MSRHNLSKEKFESMVSNEKYTILNYYCIEDRDTKFVEIESPFNQKIFFIRIPSKFQLFAPKSASIIYMKEIDPDEDSVAYWNSFKELQFIVISSIYLTYVDPKKEVIRTFELQSEPLRSKIDPIKLLEKKTKRFIVEKKKGDHEIIKDPFAECTDDETNDEKKPKPEIVFEDNEGNVIDDNDPVQKMLDKKGSESSDDDTEEVLGDDEGDGPPDDDDNPLFYFSSEEDDFGQVQLESKRIKDVHDEIQEHSVGQFYICVDLKYFFDHVKTFDDDIARQYSIIQKREEEENEKRFNNVLELIDQYKEYLKTEYKTLTMENITDSEDLRRLSRITVGTKKKLKNSPNNEELKNLYNQSMSMVEDIHSRIMERRDKISELLLDTKTYIDELMF